MDRKVYVIDGNHFSNLEEFFAEISSTLIPGMVSCKSLDSFNDILRGDYGPLERNFILIWRNADISRITLGYEETIVWTRLGLEVIRQGLDDDQLMQREYARIKASLPDGDDALHLRLLNGFASAYHKLEHDLALQQHHQGETLFDRLVALILDEHPNVELRLE